MSAAKTLLQQRKELERHPLVGASADFLEDDIFTWYCVLLYKDFPLRVCLQFDRDYPISPPKAYFESFVAYEGGAVMKDSQGRFEVCLSLFGNFRTYHTEWANAQGEGWSPSYTVSTILVAMQGLMLGDMLSNRPADETQMRSSALTFRCSATKHNGADRSTWFPKVYTAEYEVKAFQESIGVVRSSYDVLRDHYVCYVSKSNVLDDKCTLGYGVHVENPRNSTLSSPCEYLSFDAFYPGCTRPEHLGDSGTGIRRSSMNKPIEYWVPVLLHSGDWAKVKPLFMQCMDLLERGLRLNCTPTARSENVLKVCGSVMNSLVVEVMNGSGSGSGGPATAASMHTTANDKFIDGYFAFYRLLKQYAGDHPDLVTFVDAKLASFIKTPSQRVKAVVPNLGELLIYLTVSAKFTWTDMWKAYQQESDARSVFWYCIGTQRAPPRFPELRDPNNNADRNRKVFEATAVGRSLAMYQVKFSQVVNTATATVSALSPVESTSSSCFSSSRSTPAPSMETPVTPPVPPADEWVGVSRNGKKLKPSIHPPAETPQGPPPTPPVAPTQPPFDIQLDANHGLIPSGLKTELKEYYQHIGKVVNWRDYFTELKMDVEQAVGPPRTSALVAALHASVAQGYSNMPNSNTGAAGHRNSYRNKGYAIPEARGRCVFK